MASKYIEFLISQELLLLKNDDDSNNWLKLLKKKILTKLSQKKVRKSHEILDQFDKTIKIYIKMFEAAGLLGLPSSPGRVKRCLTKYSSVYAKLVEVWKIVVILKWI